MQRFFPHFRRRHAECLIKKHERSHLLPGLGGGDSGPFRNRGFGLIQNRRTPANPSKGFAARGFAFLLVFVPSLFSLPSYAGESSARFVPPDGKVLVIVGQNNGSFEAYVAGTKNVPAGFMTYTSVQRVEGLETPVTTAGVTQHAQALVDSQPNTVAQVGLYMVDALDGVIDGSYDTNLDHLGNWIKETKRPVFLRIGYEFDGGHNHYDPAKYIQAYRHIVDRFRKNGVENAAYVWHSFGVPVSQPLENWYPGDSYVDWFGISYFDQPQAMMLPMVQLAKTHHKPTMLAECTPKGCLTAWGKGTWNSWFAPYFRFVEENHVQAICYIDDNWNSIAMWKGQNWGDARIEKNAYIQEHWLKEIQKEKYLHSSPELFATLGYSSAEPRPPGKEDGATP